MQHQAGLFYSVCFLGRLPEKKIRKKFGLVLNPPRMPFIFCPFRLAKFGQIMTIKNFVLIIFFGKFFFWCKICFSQYRCIFQQQKMGVKFFHRKKTKLGGGVQEGFGKRPHFFRIFFSATFPYKLIRMPVSLHTYLSDACSKQFYTDFYEI